MNNMDVPDKPNQNLTEEKKEEPPPPPPLDLQSLTSSTTTAVAIAPNSIAPDTTTSALASDRASVDTKTNENTKTNNNAAKSTKIKKQNRNSRLLPIKTSFEDEDENEERTEESQTPSPTRKSRPRRSTSATKSYTELDGEPIVEEEEDDNFKTPNQGQHSYEMGIDSSPVPAVAIIKGRKVSVTVILSDTGDKAKVGSGRSGKNNGSDLRSDQSFQARVNELKDFKKEYGHTRPTISQNKSLNMWCTKVRRSHRKVQKGLPETTKKVIILTEERALLNEIGFFSVEPSNDNHENASNTQEQEHEVVKNTNSKKIAAISHSESDAISPPAMTKKEQQQKKLDAKFKMKVERLKEFKEKNGHTNVTLKFDVPLTKWCSDVRRGTVRMTEVREQWLREVGFDFGQDKQRISDIKTPKQPEQTNDNDISAHSMDNDVLVENANVAIGTNQQKQRAGIPQININGDGNGRSGIYAEKPVPGRKHAQFQANIERLKVFKARHGHTNVPWDCKDDLKLARWCGNIRAGKITLTDSRIELLREVGFNFPEINGAADKKEESSPTKKRTRKRARKVNYGDNPIEDMPKSKKNKTDSQKDRAEPKPPSVPKFHMIEPLLDAPTLPSFPNTGKCEWTFDSQSRVLLGCFKIDRENPSVLKEDESFLLEMMERSDIAVVSEGLFYNSDESVWDLDFVSARTGDKTFHRFRLFDAVPTSQGNFNRMRLGLGPETLPESDDNESSFRHSREIDGDITMKIKDYIRYLHTFNNVQDDENIDPVFSLLDTKGVEMKFDVKRHSLYMIDFDLGKLLPETFADFRESFRLPGLLPGGEYCMMNPVRCALLGQSWI